MLFRKLRKQCRAWTVGKHDRTTNRLVIGHPEFHAVPMVYIFKLSSAAAPADNKLLNNPVFTSLRDDKREKEREREREREREKKHATLKSPLHKHFANYLNLKTKGRQ